MTTENSEPDEIVVAQSENPVPEERTPAGQQSEWIRCIREDNTERAIV
jgi:hypothetical protein